MAEAVDGLFIEEAGVLLGDPQQLEQPLQGVHPPGAACSSGIRSNWNSHFTACTHPAQANHVGAPANAEVRLAHPAC
jgi:hypothetical protein